MPRTKLPYLNKHVTRHGKTMWCVRVDRAQPRIWLRGDYGSKEFMEQYRAALVGDRPIKKDSTEEKKFTVGWAITAYMKSFQWAKLLPESRKQLSYQYARIKEKAGDVPLMDVTPAVVLEGRDARGSVPSDANKFVRATKLLFNFAVFNKWVLVNPATDVGILKTSKTGEGFIIWTDAHHALFEARWPIGTRQRLAYEIAYCTGLRRSDICRFGPKHVTDGSYSITPKKTELTGMVVYGDILGRLQEAIDAVPTSGDTFVVTDHGRPFTTAASFGNWFGKACKIAGVPGSAHGIRKSVASAAAEQGATTAQLNSLFGWSHRSKESATYIDKASRTVMAKAASKLLAHPRKRGGQTDS